MSRTAWDTVCEWQKNDELQSDAWEAKHPGQDQGYPWRAYQECDSMGAHIINAGSASSASIIVSEDPTFVREPFSWCINARKPQSNVNYRETKTGAGSSLNIVVALNGDEALLKPQEKLWLPPAGSTRADTVRQTGETATISTLCPPASYYDDPIGCTVSHARLEPGQQDVLHLSFQHWPDMSVPTAENQVKLRSLVSHVAQLRASQPAAITYAHCAAGRGRSGTFAGMLLQHEAGHTLSPAELVTQMRQCRYGLVSNESQFQLLL